MRRSRTFTLTIVLLAFWISIVRARQAGVAAWQDPSRHEVKFVTVDEGCDWRFLTGAGQDDPSYFSRGRDTRPMFTTSSPRNSPIAATCTASRDAASVRPVGRRRATTTSGSPTTCFERSRRRHAFIASLA
jgi:hypothetical protein